MRNVHAGMRTATILAVCGYMGLAVVMSACRSSGTQTTVHVEHHRGPAAAPAPPPAWVSETIEVSGSGTDHNIHTPQGRAKAVRAAELDAYRKLAEYINGLHLTSQTYVRDFVTESDEIATRVQAVIKGARLSPARFDEGIATVTARIYGAQVWEIMKTHVEVRH